MCIYIHNYMVLVFIKRTALALSRRGHGRFQPKDIRQSHSRTQFLFSLCYILQPPYLNIVNVGIPIGCYRYLMAIIWLLFSFLFSIYHIPASKYWNGVGYYRTEKWYSLLYIFNVNVYLLNCNRMYFFK